VANRFILGMLLAIVAGAALLAAAQERSSAPSTAAASASTSASTISSSSESAQRAEGEKRFSTNCGRCHMAPHKFSPRIMATVVRHMRVRATLTDEDMRIILHYLTQ
jgi:cytochrome c5